MHDPGAQMFANAAEDTFFNLRVSVSLSWFFLSRSFLLWIYAAALAIEHARLFLKKFTIFVFVGRKCYTSNLHIWICILHSTHHDALAVGDAKGKGWRQAYLLVYSHRCSGYLALFFSFLFFHESSLLLPFWYPPLLPFDTWLLCTSPSFSSSASSACPHFRFNIENKLLIILYRLWYWSKLLWCVAVNAFIIYGAVGFFGAAYYGSNTEQNILVNQWLGGGVAQGILNLSMAGMATKIFSPFFFFPHCKPYMCSLAGFLSKVWYPPNSGSYMISNRWLSLWLQCICQSPTQRLSFQHDTQLMVGFQQA